MKDCFKWIIRWTLLQESDLMAALKKFLKTNQIFKMIKHITDDEFTKMNIENGLRNQI